MGSQTIRVDTGLDTWIKVIDPDGCANWHHGAVCKRTDGDGLRLAGKERWDVSVWFGPRCEGVHFRAATREEGVAIISGVHALGPRGPLHEAILAYRGDA